jgi:hypothetical protein
MSSTVSAEKTSNRPAASAEMPADSSQRVWDGMSGERISVAAGAVAANVCVMGCPLLRAVGRGDSGNRTVRDPFPLTVLTRTTPKSVEISPEGIEWNRVNGTYI